MPTLQINTVHGMPAFTLSCAGSDSIAKLTVAAGRKARVMRQLWKNMKLVDDKATVPVRLSLGRKFLGPRDTVAELALKDGMILTMHVQATPLVRGSAPLPTYSFLGEGYCFFVNIVSGKQGRPLFKLKVSRNQPIAAVLEMAVRRASISGLGEAQSAEFRFRNKVLRPDKTIEFHSIGKGDALELHGLDSDEPEPPPSPRSLASRPVSTLGGIAVGSSSSHNILAYSFSSTSRRGYRSSLASPVTSSQLRPKSAGHDPGRHDPIWLPVGLAIR